jgi:hypothetical protein
MGHKWDINWREMGEKWERIGRAIGEKWDRNGIEMGEKWERNGSVRRTREELWAADWAVLINNICAMLMNNMYTVARAIIRFFK